MSRSKGLFRLFCNHKNEKILYLQKDDTIPFWQKERIFYCPDCKSYSRMILTNGGKTFIKTHYRSDPGDISNFTYLGGNE